jgi:zinc D-Ala-D-Ala carboxypeptidase
VKLSHHFTLAELTRSSVATARGIDNTPPPELLPRLVRTAEMLERIRSTLQCPVIVTSGYRCPELNAAVGSRTTSDHTQGHAADIVAPMFGHPTEVARILAPLVSVLGIGQLILEGVGGKQWVHVSTHEPEKAVNRILTITDAGTVPGIVGLA